MAFVKINQGANVAIPIKSGVTLAAGVLVELDTGRADLLASGASGTGIGVCRVGGTGNAGGTVLATVDICGPNDVLETEWTTAAAPGDQLDIASGSAGVTTDSNHDVTVLAQADDKVRVYLNAAVMKNY